MFEQLQPIKADAILSLSVEFKADTNPNKIDLGVGVYKTEAGDTPVLAAVKQAESFLLSHQASKSYLAPIGNAGFNQSMLELVFGNDHSVMTNKRARAVQAPGGTGALSLAARLIARCNSGANVWVSNPTWANHIPLIQGAGLTIKEYTYYDTAAKSIDFEGMMNDLRSGLTAGDVVLIHGCCHNPCGADLSIEQWHQLTDLVNEKGATPFVDLAYQGFGAGLEEDVAGLRYMAANVKEMLVAASCSKNFGLYRERVGATMVVSESEQASSNAVDNLGVVARGIWSMPPDHGAAIVETILASPELTGVWHQELVEMCDRINGLRTLVAQSLKDAGVAQSFDFMTNENGMFSFLGITPEQVAQLKADYSIYMVSSSRINVAGLNANNLPYFVDAMKKVVG
jgi:aspartate aminotransferase